MRLILNRLITATNLPISRYAVRLRSSDAKPAKDETKTEEAQKEPEKTEIKKKSKVKFIYLFAEKYKEYY